MSLQTLKNHWNALNAQCVVSAIFVCLYGALLEPKLNVSITHHRFQATLKEIVHQTQKQRYKKWGFRVTCSSPGCSSLSFFVFVSF